MLTSSLSVFGAGVGTIAISNRKDLPSYPQSSSPAPPPLTLVSFSDSPVSDVSCLQEHTDLRFVPHEWELRGWGAPP